MQRPLVVLLPWRLQPSSVRLVAADGAVCVENATIDDLPGALRRPHHGGRSGARLRGADRRLRSRRPAPQRVREMNPDALQLRIDRPPANPAHAGR